MFEATSVQVEGFSILKLSFPSPQLLGQSVDLSAVAKLTLSTQGHALLTWPGQAQTATQSPPAFDVVVQAKKAEPETKPTLVLSVSAIAVDIKGNGSVQLQVRDANLAAPEGAGDLYLKISGGDLVEFAPATALLQTPKGLQFKQAVPIKLTFNNVRDSTDVVLTLLGKDAKPKIDEVRLDVWTLAAPKAAASTREGN